MKRNTSLIWIAALLVLASSLYRVWDNRPWGFTPIFAMAIFAGAVIKDRKWAFLLPVLSLFLSDVLYEMLYRYGLTEIPGFYSGQVVNYVLLAGMVVFGWMIRTITVWRVLLASLAAPIVYFLVSNFLVWAGGGGWHRPMTFDGLMLCYADGLPFLKGYLLGSVAFSALFFGVYYLAGKTRSALQSRNPA